jgi:hypothetical protein
VARDAISSGGKGCVIEEESEKRKVDRVNEAKLIEKLRLIEALFAGAATDGEKLAAERAKERILKRLTSLEQEEPPVEHRFTMGDVWSRKIFVTLLRRYGITPYRYSGQRYTTVMARVSKRFVIETLWPEFQEISETLRAYLSEVTDRVVSQVIHQDSSEAKVVQEPNRLPEFSTGSIALSGPAGQPGLKEPPVPEDGGPKNSLMLKGKKHRRRKRR